MLKNISPARLAGWWAAAVIVTMSCGVVAGGAITMAVMLLLWRGNSPVTATEALYSVTSQKEGRR